MKCDLCDKPATLFLTQIVDGQMQKVNLCEQCSKEKGVTDPTGFALADLLMGVGTSEAIAPPPSAAPVAPREAEAGGGDVCPQCGFSQTELRRTGRLGCPSCYGVFRAGIQQMIGAMHRGNRHRGKVPARQLDEGVLSERLDDLRRCLAEAVKAERFEEAARLRDELKRMQSTPAQ